VSIAEKIFLRLIKHAEIIVHIVLFLCTWIQIYHETENLIVDELCILSLMKLGIELSRYYSSVPNVPNNIETKDLKTIRL